MDCQVWKSIPNGPVGSAPALLKYLGSLLLGFSLCKLYVSTYRLFVLAPNPTCASLDRAIFRPSWRSLEPSGRR